MKQFTIPEIVSALNLVLRTPTDRVRVYRYFWTRDIKPASRTALRGCPSVYDEDAFAAAKRYFTDIDRNTYTPPAVTPPVESNRNRPGRPRLRPLAA